MLFEPVPDQKAKILVIGVGGGGGNALNRMIEDGMNAVQFIAINTDAQDLDNNNSQKKLQIGKELTRGLGAGADSTVGTAAVEENKDIIIEEIKEADMVFITAGMGGGTGTGAAPAVAKIAKDLGALTIGIVTKPFAFEGPIRKKRAIEGIKEMKRNCDTLLVIPNETLLELADDNTTVNQSFKLADSVLNQATKGISELINKPGLINLDFADVKTVMQNMGDAIMGSGIAKGEEKAILAAQQAINSPLLQNANIKGAKGLLVNITGPSDMTIHELNSASSIIYEQSGEDANVILGCVIDPSITDEINVTVIATGLNSDEYHSFFHKETMEDYQQEKKIINNSEINDKNDDIEKVETKKEEKEDNVPMFGEELDIPTYLRNKNS
ncbi:MAG: cell division protein FtsZ [Candidatus Marinimicrobia bacterium]|nr:cell division protein FtsZ [Candidatus Neomarinimicrobiota bacterium]|tara:strand:- start:12115 stop:13266 length:1152 start_codon:yes stop_codon:yes gene_type:complete